MSEESYIVHIKYVKGQRIVKRYPLHVHLDLARGQPERCADLVLREAIKDLMAEQTRRADAAHRRRRNAETGWNPNKTQVRRTQ